MLSRSLHEEGELLRKVQLGVGRTRTRSARSENGEGELLRDVQQ
jgi:hypothetical protein